MSTSPISSNISILPKEVVLHALTFLEIKDLHQAMQVNTSWKELAQNERLWKKKISYLPSSEPKTFATLSAHIRSHLDKVKKASSLLDIKVKTAGEFDRIGLPYLYGTSDHSEVEAKQVLDGLTAEIIEKLTLTDALAEGFESALKLFQMDLISYQEVEKFAIVLDEKYGSEEPWLFLARHFILEGKFSEAETIMDKHLKKSIYLSDLVSMMVNTSCQKNEFEKGIQIVEKYKDAKYFRSEESTNTLLAYAYEAEKLDVVENVIDRIVSDDWKQSNAQDLIEKTLKQKGTEKAKGLYRKYKTLFSDNLEDYEVHSLIRLLVKLGYIQKAWELSLARKEKDELVLYVLRNAFSDHGLKEEEQKVEKLLPKD